MIFMGTKAGQERKLPTFELYSPHKVVITFENVGTSTNPMSFQLDTVRHVEGRPKAVAQTLESQIARLVTSDSALDLLRKHDLHTDNR